MKMSDLLRGMADMMDKEEGPGQSDRPENSAKTSDSFQHDVEDGAESGNQDVELGTMMPPLQQKLEILKKTAGMDNAFNGQIDELGDIKKLTGLKAVIGQVAGEDNDIVG